LKQHSEDGRLLRTRARRSLIAEVGEGWEKKEEENSDVWLGPESNECSAKMRLLFDKHGMQMRTGATEPCWPTSLLE
jgi:hypothetical protein